MRKTLIKMWRSVVAVPGATFCFCMTCSVNEEEGVVSGEAVKNAAAAMTFRFDC